MTIETRILKKCNNLLEKCGSDYLFNDINDTFDNYKVETTIIGILFSSYVKTNNLKSKILLKELTFLVQNLDLSNHAFIKDFLDFEMLNKFTGFSIGIDNWRYLIASCQDIFSDDEVTEQQFSFLRDIMYQYLIQVI